MRKTFEAKFSVHGGVKHQNICLVLQSLPFDGLFNPFTLMFLSMLLCLYVPFYFSFSKCLISFWFPCFSFTAFFALVFSNVSYFLNDFFTFMRFWFLVWGSFGFLFFFLVVALEFTKHTLIYQNDFQIHTSLIVMTYRNISPIQLYSLFPCFVVLLLSILY